MTQIIGGKADDAFINSVVEKAKTRALKAKTDAERATHHARAIANLAAQHQVYSRLHNGPTARLYMTRPGRMAALFKKAEGKGPCYRLVKKIHYFWSRAVKSAIREKREPYLVLMIDQIQELERLVKLADNGYRDMF